ncbi:MAG: GNAT family N-acetyltransferase [Pseudomonadota bacterium]
MAKSLATGNGVSADPDPIAEVAVSRIANGPEQLAQINAVMTVMETAFDPAYGEAWNHIQTRSMLMMPSSKLWLAYAPTDTDTSPEPSIVGFVIASGYGDEQEIMLVAVSPEWRLRGVGRTLLQAVFDDAKLAGITKLFLEMRHNNPAAHFYNSLGFTTIGRRRQYYTGNDGQKYDAVTLKKSTA